MMINSFGIAHRFAADHPNDAVRVLTHDTGPMASAKMVGVEIAPIPDEWLLPPETSEKDKAIKALEAKVKSETMTMTPKRLNCPTHRGRPPDCGAAKGFAQFAALQRMALLGSDSMMPSARQQYGPIYHHR
jgi:hypothetical protein